MKERIVRVRLIALSLLLLCTGMVWVLPYLGHAASGEEFVVTFLNVGQGDAILIETPDGLDVLIDGGPDSSVLSELAGTLGAFDRTIDMLIATHPDADHVGGLADVLARYEVNTILMTENKGESNAAETYLAHVKAEEANIIYARTGQKFRLGEKATLAVLFPLEDPSGMESNASSIVLKLSYGESDFLLTGDAPKETEAYLVETYGAALESEVLKAGHHGSRTSTSESFVEAVAPDHAVISAGADNSYGHPHEEVLATLEKYGVETASTANGRVTFVSDGIHVERK